VRRENRPILPVSSFFHYIVVRLIGFGVEYCRWDRPVATIQTDGYPLTMALHSFDQQIVVANETDTIRYSEPPTLSE